MNISLSPEAEAILKEYKERGEYEKSSVIHRLPLPPRNWWNAVSKGAKSERPFWAAAKEIAIICLKDPEIRAWPPALYETAEELPPVSKSEAVAIIERFLKIETGRFFAGIPLYQLHWDVLCSHYCPLRERYQVLRQLIAEKMLTESAKGVQQENSEKDSGLKWPLIITDHMIANIRKSRLKWRLPTFRLIEDFLSDLLASYPNIIKVVIWLVVGGGLMKLIDFILKKYF
jgi:hypothetical protein